MCGWLLLFDGANLNMRLLLMPSDSCTFFFFQTITFVCVWASMTLSNHPDRWLFLLYFTAHNEHLSSGNNKTCFCPTLTNYLLYLPFCNATSLFCVAFFKVAELLHLEGCNCMCFCVVSIVPNFNNSLLVYSNSEEQCNDLVVLVVALWSIAFVLCFISCWETTLNR